MQEEPTNFLTGKIYYRGTTGDLSDMWELAHGNHNSRRAPPVFGGEN
jgi:hypothetical protein